MVKFKIGFTISAETLFSLMSKMLPIDNLEVQEVMERPAHAPPRHAHALRRNIAAQVKRLGPDSQSKRRRELNLKEGINGVLLAALSDGETHKAAELKPLLKAAGFSQNSVGSRLQSLREHGVVKQMGDGGWRLIEIENAQQRA
jgi:DNA-binding transcriptional ArsR family regulator